MKRCSSSISFIGTKLVDYNKKLITSGAKPGGSGQPPKNFESCSRCGLKPLGVPRPSWLCP